MRFLSEIKQRRLLPIMLAYLVTGIVAVEIVSQIVSVGALPEIANAITLILYLFGILSSLIFAWFHGAAGRQRSSNVEIFGHCSVAILAIVSVVTAYRNNVLEQVTADVNTLDPRSVAVLYFEDFSSDDSLQDDADGITADLIDHLSSVRALDVVSKNGAWQYRNTDLPLDEIAQQLQVGTLIKGSVDTRDGNLRISTRMIDGFSGADIERSSVELPRADFLDSQNVVAENIANMLRIRLGEEIQVRELRRSASSHDAWSLVQRANRLRARAEENFNNGGIIASILEPLYEADGYLEQAQSLDNEWVEIPTQRAHLAYRKAWFLATGGDVRLAADEINNGATHTAQALSLNDSYPAALEQRGTLRILASMLNLPMGDSSDVPSLEDAKQDLDSAIEGDPTLASAYSMLSFLYVGLGDLVETAINARLALEEDAYLSDADRIYDRLFYAYYDLAQFRNAEIWCKNAAIRFPDNFRFAECQLWLAALPTFDVSLEEAQQLLAKLDGLAPDSLRQYKHAVGQILVAGAHRNHGLIEEAANLYSDIVHNDIVDPTGNLFEIEAGIRSSTGDLEGALAAMRKWEAILPEGRLQFDSSSNLHWWYDNLQDHPEFQRYLN